MKSNTFCRERSSGGLVLKGTSHQGNLPAKILMIRVKNLEGSVLWTFPKGHVEAGETPAEAAVREVWEETGWNCKILPARFHPHFTKVRYKFKRKNLKVNKEVIWFLMKPLRKTGRKDDSEILQTNWFKLERAQEKIVYPSDRRLLQKLLSDLS